MLAMLAKLQGSDDMDLLIKRFDPGKFPVTGDDLIAKGMKPGPELGKELADLRNKWKQSGFTATKDELLKEDAVPYADIAAMATVAGVTWPIMKNMIKVAWKTGKGMYKITRLAQKAGVKLAKFSMGEENEKTKFVPNEQYSRRKSQALHR
jgi:hypothetical protein